MKDLNIAMSCIEDWFEETLKAVVWGLFRTNLK